MPECYTHSYIATQALMRSGLTVASRPAFMAGANGPDPLFMYQPWKKNRHPDLPALADKMHREKTGEFLEVLLHHAVTPVQQSFALGFLTHYTTDCTFFPYIEAINKLKGLGKNQQKTEASLDSTLYYQDYKTYTVPLHAGTPVLITEDLAQVSSLLHETIKAVYNVDIPAVALADMYHDNLYVRRMLLAKPGPKRLLVKLMQARGGGNYHREYSDRIQPAKPLVNLPEKWVNPYTKEEMNLTLAELLALAEQTGAVCMTAAMKFWLGELDDESLPQLFGNNNYYTGLPIETGQATDALPEEEAT